MNNSEYYDLLNIKKSASEGEIKKAYRKLALKFHPDKAPDDKKEEFSEQFKKISEAYGVLSDPEKKQIYDQFGKDGLEAGGGGGGPNPFDIFNEIFGSQGGFSQMHGFPPGVHVRMGGMGGHPFFNNANFIKKTRDTVIRLNVTLKEVFTGVSKEVKITRNVNGKTEDVSMKISIPAGCDNGIKMVKKGAGNKQEDFEPGDVVIIINHEDHKLFKLSDNHIVMEKSISFGSSLVGVKFSVEHLNGEIININIDGPIEDSSLRVIKGKGVPHMKHGMMGDFVIRFDVSKQYTLSKEDKKKIAQIFPVDKFHVNPKGKDYDAIDPKLFNNDSDDERTSGQNVQCAQS